MKPVGRRGRIDDAGLHEHLHFLEVSVDILEVEPERGVIASHAAVSEHSVLTCRKGYFKAPVLIGNFRREPLYRVAYTLAFGIEDKYRKAVDLRGKHICLLEIPGGYEAQSQSLRTGSEILVHGVARRERPQ